MQRFTGGADGIGGGAAGTGAVAGSGVAGTQSLPQNTQAVTPPETPTEPDIDSSIDPGDTPLANGRAPQDIPSADSDGALAAQIRLAAETETNPQRQALLWNEYRKIRGLPTR